MRTRFADSVYVRNLSSGFGSGYGRKRKLFHSMKQESPNSSAIFSRRTAPLKHHGQRKSEKTVKRTLRREGSTRPSLAGGARADNAADGACVARTRATFSIRPGN